VGFGVWSNVILGHTLVSDYFTSNESIVGDGQTGYLFWWFAIRLFSKQGTGWGCSI
jgi:hypothetical protein